jgi:hypothetical protein
MFQTVNVWDEFQFKSEAPPCGSATGVRSQTYLTFGQKNLYMGPRVGVALTTQCTARIS